MKNIYVKGRDGTNSLPILIKMFQYNKAWLVSNFGFNPNSKSTAASGNMGDKFFDFSVDCAHEFIGTYKDPIEDDPFKYINNILRSSSNPTIKREDLTERFFILECPDFGNQAMTSFYRDFVPQVWYKGKKIWQKYIGVIKYYPRKLAYIVIPKNTILSQSFLNTNITDKVMANDYDEFVIRAAFKNNIEDIYAIDKTKQYYSLKTTLNATHEEIAKIELEDIDVFTSRDVHEDFDLYFRETGEAAWKKVLNSRMFYKLELSPNPDNGYTVQRQTKSDGRNLSNIDPSIDINPKETYDYYKQSFFKDYIDNDTNKKDQEYNRSTNTKYSLYITLSLDEKATPVEICLVPRSNLYDALYISKDTTTGKFKLTDVQEYYPVKYPEDIMVFDKDGKKIIDPAIDVFGDSPITEDNEYEIIPEYSSIRKYEWKNVENLSLDSNYISAFLKGNSLYPWATKHPEVLAFTGDGKLLPQPEYSYSDGSLLNSEDIGDSFADLIIYWNEEEHIKDNDVINNAIAVIQSSATGNELHQFIDGDESLFASNTKSYNVLSDEQLISRVDLVDNDNDDSTDTRYSAVFPYNDSNLELSKVLDTNEPKFHVDGKNYVYLNSVNSNNEIDYDNFKAGVAKLTPNGEYSYERNSRENEVDIEFDNLSKNIANMFCYGQHQIYTTINANPENNDVPFNATSEYFLLEFTNTNRAAVYLVEENDGYSDIKSAEFVNVFECKDSFFGVYVPSGAEADTSKAYLYSPNNPIKKLHILRQN